MTVAVKGSCVELWCDSDWWSIQVVKVQDENVLQSYVGGTFADDVYVRKDSTHLRTPQVFMFVMYIGIFTIYI